jgi:hypothetical protein
MRAIKDVVVNKEAGVSLLLKDPKGYNSAMSELVNCIAKQDVKYFTLNRFVQCCVNMPFKSNDDLNRFVRLVVETHNSWVSRKIVDDLSVAELLKEAYKYDSSYDIYDKDLNYVAQQYLFNENDFWVVYRTKNVGGTPVCILWPEKGYCKSLETGLYFDYSYDELIVRDSIDGDIYDIYYDFGPNTRMTDFMDISALSADMSSVSVQPCHSPLSSIKYDYVPSTHDLVRRYEEVLKKWPKDKLITKEECDTITESAKAAQKRLLNYNNCVFGLYNNREHLFARKSVNFGTSGQALEDLLYDYLHNCMKSNGSYLPERSFTDPVSCRRLNARQATCSGIISTEDITFTLANLDDPNKLTTICERPSVSETFDHYQTNAFNKLYTSYKKIHSDDVWSSMVTVEECNNKKSVLLKQLDGLKQLDRCYRDLKIRRNTIFYDKQVKSLTEVASVVAQELDKCMGDYLTHADFIRDITCTGECHTLPYKKDFPVCTGIGNEKVEFTFEDICNWFF